jgi:hypothetical protein
MNSWNDIIAISALNLFCPAQHSKHQNLNMGSCGGKGSELALPASSGDRPITSKYVPDNSGAMCQAKRAFPLPRNQYWLADAPTKTPTTLGGNVNVASCDGDLSSPRDVPMKRFVLRSREISTVSLATGREEPPLFTFQLPDWDTVLLFASLEKPIRHLLVPGSRVANNQTQRE